MMIVWKMFCIVHTTINIPTYMHTHMSSSQGEPLAVG